MPAPIPCTEQQTLALAELKTRYREPLIVGWNSTASGLVRVSLFESVEHDERGHWYADGHIAQDGSLSWTVAPPVAGP